MQEFNVLNLNETTPMCGTCRHCTAIIYGIAQEGFLVASAAGTALCTRFPPIFGNFPGVDALCTYCGEHRMRCQEEINAVAIEAQKQATDVEKVFPQKPSVSSMEVQ